MGKFRNNRQFTLFTVLMSTVTGVALLVVLLRLDRESTEKYLSEQSLIDSLRDADGTFSDEVLRAFEAIGKKLKTT